MLAMPADNAVERIEGKRSCEISRGSKRLVVGREGSQPRADVRKERSQSAIAVVRRPVQSLAPLTTHCPTLRLLSLSALPALASETAKSPLHLPALTEAPCYFLNCDDVLCRCERRVRSEWQAREPRWYVLGVEDRKLVSDEVIHTAS